jgi:hypothetical protein
MFFTISEGALSLQKNLMLIALCFTTKLKLMLLENKNLVLLPFGHTLSLYLLTIYSQSRDVFN